MMTIDEALASITLLGLDTSPFIYFAEQDPNYFLRVQPVFQRLKAGQLEAVTSVLTLTETLIHPMRLGNNAQVEQYRELILGTQNIMTLYIDEFIALTAADLRARYRLKTPDAIQLATAISEECEAFLTNDRDLRRVTEISVLILDDLTL